MKTINHRPTAKIGDKIKALISIGTGKDKKMQVTAEVTESVDYPMGVYHAIKIAGVDGTVIIRDESILEVIK